MNWFTIAIIAPFLFAMINHVDKYLLSKFSHEGGVGSIAIFSSLFSFFALPVIYLFNIPVFGIQLQNAVILIIGGLISGLAVLLYLLALDEGEATNVVPLLQTIPIFGFILGLVFLNEKLSIQHIFAALLIVFGATILTIEKDESGSFTFKKKIMILMLTSSFLYATYDTIFKYIALNETFWVSTFWQTTGYFLFGLLLFLINKRFRNEFKRLISRKSGTLFSLNIFIELANLGGNLATGFASLLAPIALVMTVSGYQPVFVFVMGVIMAIFFPHISNEDIQKHALLRKVFSIAIILTGTYLILN